MFPLKLTVPGLLRCVLVQLTRTLSTTECAPLKVASCLLRIGIANDPIFFFSARAEKYLATKIKVMLEGGGLQIFEGPAVQSHGAPTSHSLVLIALYHL